MPPPASPQHEYGIPTHGLENDFFAQPATLVQDEVPRRMFFSHGATEARVPTPFSRAYLFYFGLNGGFLLPDPAQHAEEQEVQCSAATSDARKELLRRARGAFRGICALFALRQVFHFNLELRRAQSFSNARTDGSVLYPMLARHLRNDPHRETWDAPSYYVLLASDDGSQVVAGVSPLTGFFPAARRLKEIPSAYWYDPATGWQDPGEPNRPDWKRMDRRLQPAVRVLLLAWVMEVCRRLSTGARPMQAALRQLGVTLKDIAHLEAEFENWRGELTAQTQTDLAAGFDNANVTLRDVPIPHRAADAYLHDLREVPFFNLACDAGAFRFLYSDVTSANNRLLLTREDLTDPQRRLHGPAFGSPAYRDRLANLPLAGDNLGRDLGLGDRAIPVRYLYLNKCFTPRLMRVTSKGLSPEWKGLMAKGEGVATGQAPVYLFPIDRQALKYLPLETLGDAITLTETAQPGTQPQQEVALQLDGVSVKQAYGDPTQPEFTIDRVPHDRFDLRVFPNLRLDEVSKDVLPDDSPDRVYFARLRLSREWGGPEVPSDFLVPLAGTQPAGIDDWIDVGSFDDGQGNTIAASGKARFLRFRETPAGFYFKDRGICLLQLQRGPNRADNPAQWEIAVDFGTSNTCVAYRNRAVGNPDVLKLPMLTTSLQAQPLYGSVRGTDEGLSAQLDFFVYDPKEAFLHNLDFFPSQVATREQNKPKPGDEESIKNGMVVFKNFSHLILEEYSIARLLENFSPNRGDKPGQGPEPELRPRFRIIQDIKWADDKWMDVFMHGLRRHVVLAAAKRNARVHRLVFSHPKSFSMHQVDNFEHVLVNTWQSYGQGKTKPDLMSESEGVRNYIAQAHYRDCMVFDIGGKTTDVLAFCGQRSFFQMSFKLAAGILDRYVIASNSLRQQFIAAAVEMRGNRVAPASLEQLGFHEHVPLVTNERLDPTIAMVRCQTVWHGLLSDVDSTNDGMARFGHLVARDIYDRQKTSSEGKKAIRGFYLSLLVTFGGLAYLGGMMNRRMRTALAKETGGGPANPLQLTFVGNGGKYYELLENKRRVFAGFLECMFSAGEGHGGQNVECIGVFPSQGGDSHGSKQPKAAIALGMLIDSTEGDASKMAVCNFLGENAFRVGDKVFTGSERLEDFYSSVPATTNRPGENARIERAEGSALDAFLTAMAATVPGGMFGETVVVPGLSKCWDKEIFGSAPVEARIAARTRARLQESARLWQEEMGRVNGREVALEPVFVAELASLLEEIRESHAG